MWSSVANLKENLNKIAHDVHDDDEDDDEDLTIYGSTNGGTDRRNSNGFRYSRSPMANGFESPVNPEIERYKAEINKLQKSESEIKALSVNYAALLKEKEDQISRLNQENGSLKQNLTSTNAALKESRLDLSRASNNNAIKGNGDHSPNRSQRSPTNWKNRNQMNNGIASKPNGTENDSESHKKEKEFAEMLEERTRSMASAQARELEKEREKSANLQILLQEERKQNETFKEELQSLRLDKEKTLMESNKVRRELDAKLAEIRQLQMKLNGGEQHAFGISRENLKEVNKALEKENNELKLKRSELEAALEASQKSTSRKLFPKSTEDLSRHLSSLDEEKAGTFPGKEDMEKSLQRLEKELEEARREKDKARQELKRLKQHLLEKETEESEKMDEDSRLIDELRQTNEYQRSQILGLEKALRQTMANQEEIKSSSDLEIRKSKGIIEDLNQKLANCLRTIDSKNVELLNLQTALGQYYAEIEAKVCISRESCFSHLVVSVTLIYVFLFL
jgi:DNA repair exonuclease SbcCD ATPase subunit